MSDRVFVAGVVIAAGLSIVIAVHALLSLIFDEDMSRKGRRASRAGGAPVNDAAGRRAGSSPRCVPNPTRGQR